MIDEVLGATFIVSIFTFLLWDVLAFLPEKRFKTGFYPPLSVVIPAHDEEKVIEATVKSVLNSEYSGELEVIVVDDGSADGTGDVVSKLAQDDERVRILSTDHLGKAAAVNHGARNSRGEIMVLLDADSELMPDALAKLAAHFADPEVGAVSGIIRVALNNNPLVWFQDFEYVLSSMWRYIFDKLGCTYVLPGFCAVRRKALLDAGGFATDTLSEDFDIGLKLHKAGWRIHMSKAVMKTHVPQTLPGVAAQRVRWGRGTVQVIRKHRDMLLNPRYGWIGLYGLPNQIYFFVQGFVIVPITMYQIINGYFEYFVSYGNYLTFDVVKYLFGWVSMYGALEFIRNVLTGVWEAPATFPVFLISYVLTYTYHLTAVKKMDGLKLKTLFGLFFFFPYYLFTLTFFVYPFLLELNPLTRMGGHINVWEKNR
jgi:cellulose synthase/poly-beta-1,6-N-acetylglucosamine synthase-like glycosyltransferase